MRVAAWWSRLRVRERRTIGWGLTLMAGAWVATRGLPVAASALGGNSARAEQQRVALSRARREIATAPQAREALAAAAARLVSWAPRLFAGTTAAETAAEVASYVTGRAVLRAVRITRQDTGPDSTVAIFRRVVLRLEVESDVTGLAAWLADLEEGEKLVTVVDLTITATEPGAPAVEVERLHAEVRLTAWSMAGPGVRP